MDHIEIKILLLRAGVSQSAIARKLHVTVGFVNQIITGRRHTKRVRMAIAEAVGKQVEDLWPESNHKKKAA
jgi:transcriptional regulator with XRE-family HTH domain